MRLFTKYSRINLLATVAIFILASAAFYFTLQFFLINQIDQDLNIEKTEITRYIEKYHRLPESIPVKDQLIEYAPATKIISTHHTTSSSKADGDHQASAFRQLIFGVETNQGIFRVTVSKSLEETDEQIHSTLLITLVTIMMILLVSFLINRLVLKKIWQPFYQSLDAVKRFNISDNQPLRLPAANVDEFDLMNQTLERMTSQAAHEYLSLKTFSENASHEIQTPIAIIRSKLDLLIQDEQLSEKQSGILQAAYDSIQKLSSLNQSLLLLAKIENKQFAEAQPVDIEKKLKDKINDFQELWMNKEIRTDLQSSPAVLLMNAELADILLNNLLSNATRHNYTGGKILISLDKNQLTVRNTSMLPALDEKQLYHRFFKSAGGCVSNGLGLSIIKQICGASAIRTSYKYENKMHCFKLSWP
jgi:signal transduction histidine kinase